VKKKRKKGEGETAPELRRPHTEEKKEKEGEKKNRPRWCARR